VNWGMCLGIMVGTKVFTFVFSQKFLRNSLFVFVKIQGKNHSMANLVYLYYQNIGKESEQCENDVALQQCGEKVFALVFFTKDFEKFFCSLKKKSWRKYETFTKVFAKT
jgi:hypothetical protein